MSDPFTLEVQLPEGLPPEEERRYIQEALAKAGKPSNVGTAQAALAGLTQGAAMDFGDELAGALSSIFTGQPREQAQAERRALYRTAQQQHPLAYNASYLAGSVLPGLITRNPTPFASAASRLLPRAVPAVLRPATESALQGGISGAGQAPPDEKVGGALTGGVFGGALGLGLQGGMALGRGVRDVYRNSYAPGSVANVLSEAVSESPGGFPGVKSALRDAQAAGQPYTLTDATPPGSRTRGLVEGVLNRTDNTNLRQQAHQLLTERAADAYERVMNKLGGILRQSPDAYAAQRTLKAEIEDSLQPVFQHVLATSGDDIITDPAVISILQERPAAKSALRKAQVIMGNMGEPFGVLAGKDGAVKGISLRTFDYVRKVLGDAVYQNLNLDTMSSALKSETVAGRKVLGQMMDSVRGQFPEYSDALDAYSSIFRLRDAVEHGTNAGSKTGKYALEAFDGIKTQAEKRAFAIGYFGKKLEKTSGQRNPASELYGSPLTRKTTDAILTALDSSETSADFGKFLTRENEMARMPGEMLGGSPTARRFSVASLFRLAQPAALAEALENRVVTKRSDQLLQLGLLNDPDTVLGQLEAAARQRARINARRAAQPFAVSPLSRLGVSVAGSEVYR